MARRKKNSFDGLAVLVLVALVALSVVGFALWIRWVLKNEAIQKPLKIIIIASFFLFFQVSYYLTPKHKDLFEAAINLLIMTTCSLGASSILIMIYWPITVLFKRRGYIVDNPA